MRMSFLTFLTKKLMRPGHIMRQVMIHLAEIKLWSSCLKRLTYLTCTLGQNKWTSIGTFNVTEVEGDAWDWGSLILTHAHAHVTAQALSMNKKVMQPGLILRYDMACAWEKSLPMAGLHRTAKKSSRPAIPFFSASRPVPRPAALCPVPSCPASRRPLSRPAIQFFFASRPAEPWKLLSSRVERDRQLIIKIA